MLTKGNPFQDFLSVCRHVKLLLKFIKDLLSKFLDKIAKPKNIPSIKNITKITNILVSILNGIGFKLSFTTSRLLTIKVTKKTKNNEIANDFIMPMIDFIICIKF